MLLMLLCTAIENLMANNTNLQFAFQKKNYMLLLIGLVILIVGYTLMSGGGSEDPTVFSEDIFSFRRITLAPIVILAGYVFVGYAIMYRDKRAVQNDQAQPVATKDKKK
jgi:membrane-bound ClpP family serine protease